jgi:hypothetical protein
MRSQPLLCVVLAWCLGAGLALSGTPEGKHQKTDQIPAGIESQVQGFESAVFPPPGWDTVQNDGGISNWYRTLTNPRSGIAAARIDYESATLPNDDWLTTPLVFPRPLPGEDSLIFYYRSQNATYIDSFEVWVSTEANGRTPAQFLSGGTKIYNNTLNNVPSYQRAAISLSAFYGQRIYMAWRYDAFNAYRCYLDDISMPDAPPAFANDIATTAFDTPLPGGFIVQGTAFAPAATFRNAGSANQSSAFNVKYEILSSTPAVVYTSTQSIASLASGVSTQVTFASVPGSLISGTYTLRATAELASDGNRANDTLTATITIEPAVSIPYTQTFEGVTDEGWTTVATGGTNEWVRGTPSKPAQIDGAHGGAKCWVTRLDSNYAVNYNAALVSPIFNLTTATGSYGLVFWHNFQTEAGYDAAVLEYSTNGGVWLRVDSVLGTGPNFSTATSFNWYNNSSGNGSVRPPKWSLSSTAFGGNDSGYVRSITKLGSLAGLPAVKLRWRFVSDTDVNAEGWAVDDVQIIFVDYHDIGMTDLSEQASLAAPAKSREAPRLPGVASVPALSVDPASPITENAPVHLRAIVRNFGAFVENSYQIGWEVDGIPQPAVSSLEPLTLGDIDTVAFVWPLPTGGLHALRAWTILGTDSIRTNDSSGVINVFVAPAYTVFVERFSGAFPPPGWTTINRDGGGSTGPWAQGSASRFSALEGAPAGFAGDEYSTANGLYIDDYLVTPNTGTPLDPGAVDSLVFYARSYDSPYPDSLEIRLSTTGSDTASFTTQLDYIEVPKTGWTRYAYRIPLATSRYIAFRYLLFDGGTAGNNSVYVGVDIPHIVRYGATTTSVNVALGTGWNMVSNPVNTPADSMKQLFPQSVFEYGFGFSSVGGYQQAYRLDGGKGYWGKMSAPHTQTISGGVRNSVTVSVSGGWNMIGSLSAAIDTSASHVSTTPPGLRASNWFKYKTAPAAGYDVTTDIVPGYAYWVKSGAAGSFTLSLTGPPSGTEPPNSGAGKGLGDLQSVTITDAQGNTQTLYFGTDAAGEIPVAMFEMPPAPPQGVFDARFACGTMVQTLSGDTRTAEFPIAITSGAYPLTVTWNIRGDAGSYELADAAAILRPTLMSGEGSVTIARPGVRLLIKATSDGQLPVDFSLAQNYPNPFNPSTTIAFGLPVAGRVTAEVYDILGRQVNTLLNEERPAGYHSLVWDGTNAAGRQLGSGTYFLRLNIRGAAGKSFTDTRKMMLMK